MGHTALARTTQVLQQARVIGPGAVEHYLGGPVEPAEARALFASARVAAILQTG